MIKGVPSSPGVGVGSAFLLQRKQQPPEEIFHHTPSDPASEMKRFLQGRAIVESYYLSLVEKTTQKGAAEEAEIFEGYIELLSDVGEGVEERVKKGSSAAQAIRSFTEETAQEFDALESEYFQARGEDIRSIGRNLIEAIYYGRIAEPRSVPPDSVIVAEDLSPAETAELNMQHVSAIVTEKGGRTSHTAILARSFSIPCVTGSEKILELVKEKQLILVDGDRGTVELDVDEEKLQQATSKTLRQKEEVQLRQVWARKTADTFADGEAYHLLSNAGGVPDAQQAASYNAKGIGLLRTEFLFMRYPDFPSRAQQANEYQAICETIAPHPVTVRLLDCGADKPLPYQVLEEDNPLLGERGIRFLLNKKAQLQRQIEAIVQVANENHAIKIMIPMVISTHEIEEVRSFIPSDIKKLELGIMIETPAAVLMISSLAKMVDFVSIGTNDLVQYVLAVDRGNAKLAEYYREFHPAVLAAIDMVVQGCHQENVPVGVCGSMASYPASALALHALGVDSLSATASAIPILKACFSQISRKELTSLKKELLAAPNASLAKEAAKALVPHTLSPWFQNV